MTAFEIKAMTSHSLGPQDSDKVVRAHWQVCSSGIPKIVSPCVPFKQSASATHLKDERFGSMIFRSLSQASSVRVVTTVSRFPKQPKPLVLCSRKAPKSRLQTCNRISHSKGSTQLPIVSQKFVARPTRCRPKDLTCLVAVGSCSSVRCPKR